MGTGAVPGIEKLTPVARRKRLREAQLGALAEWLRSGLQSRLHRFDSGRRLYWVCEVNRAGVERPFDQCAKAEAPNGGRKFIERGPPKVDLGRREFGMPEQRLGVLHAGMTRDVVGVGVAEQVWVNRCRDSVRRPA